MRTNNLTTIDKIINNQKGKATKIIITFLALCTMLCVTAYAQDMTLDDESAVAFMEELSADLETDVGDEDSINSIKEKWESRDLVGKTKSQAIGLLVADVRSVVEDPTIADALRKKWSAKLRPTPSRITPTTAPSRTTPPTNRDTIVAGNPPLSTAETSKIMEWIAVKVAAERLPYCYKQTTTRGAGVPLSSSCPAGLEKSGLLCYPKCKAGYKGEGPICSVNCPSGFTDIGLFCQKPEAYGRGAGYALWDKAKCESENAQGCEQNAAMFYPKCRAGYTAFGSNVCTPECPRGFTDTGTGCTKPSTYEREGKPLACPSGTEKGAADALCYPKCSEGYTGVGPACWAKCPSQHPVECGAGCATTTEECVNDVKEKTMSVVEATISLATAGSSSGISKVAKSLEAVTDAIDMVKNSAEAIGTIQDLVEQATNEFSDNFAEMTTDEVNNKIDAAYSEEQATYIKKEWAKRHLRMTWKANTLAAAKRIGSLASLADPSGITSVINAFSNPICEKDMPFPR